MMQSEVIRSFRWVRRVCMWLGLGDTCVDGAFRLLKRKETADEIKLGIIRHSEELYDMARFCQREY